MPLFIWMFIQLISEPFFRKSIFSFFLSLVSVFLSTKTKFKVDTVGFSLVEGFLEKLGCGVMTEEGQ